MDLYFSTRIPIFLCFKPFVSNFSVNLSFTFYKLSSRKFISGRKRVIQACSLLSALFVVASAFAQSVIQIYVIRLLIGLSMGGFHVAYTYATEVVGPEYRSKACMIIFLLHYVGVTYAAITGLVLVPNEDYGWRIYVLSSALPIGRSFLQTKIWALNLLCSRPNLA